MKIVESGLPGCKLIRLLSRPDARGIFVKNFHAGTFSSVGLRTDWKEGYYSLSKKNVVRGMHFQTPPADHAKMVVCLSGNVLDVVLDLRRGSPTYKQHRVFTLSGDTPSAIYIPTGLAHGFLSQTDDSLLLYQQTSEYDAGCDAGVSWDSFGFSWPVTTPLLSDRDRQHPVLDRFDTPFTFDAPQAAR